MLSRNVFKFRLIVLGEVGINRLRNSIIRNENNFFTLPILIPFWCYIAILLGFLIIISIIVAIFFENIQKKSNENILINEKNKEEEKKEEQKQHFKNLKKIIFFSAYRKLYLLIICLTFNSSIMNLIFRFFVNNVTIYDGIIKVCLIISSFIGTAFCPITGFLFDKFGIKVIVIPCALFSCFTGILLIIPLQLIREMFLYISIYTYSIITINMYAIIFPCLFKIFGGKYVMEVYGFVGFVITIFDF